MRRTLMIDTERIEQEELQKQQKERNEQNERMSINQELYVEELYVVAYQHANEAISEPEEEDFDDHISSIAWYHEDYCHRCYLQV